MSYTIPLSSMILKCFLKIQYLSELLLFNIHNDICGRSVDDELIYYTAQYKNIYEKHHDNIEIQYLNEKFINIKLVYEYIDELKKFIKEKILEANTIIAFKNLNSLNIRDDTKLKIMEYIGNKKIEKIIT